MFEVQEIQLKDHQGPGTPANAVPQRFLEDSDGVVRFYFCNEVMAVTRGGWWAYHCSNGPCTWLWWGFKELLWTRPQALKLLQGASLQQLMGPRYLVIGVSTRPLYYPEPGLDLLQLVERVESPPEMGDASFISMAYQCLQSCKAPVFN